MCLFVFGLHPGELFNDRRTGQGVSLVENHTLEEGERGRERTRGSVGVSESRSARSITQ